LINVYISNISSNNEYDDRFEIKGEPKYKYYVEVKEIEKLLFDYLCGLNKFPIYLKSGCHMDLCLIWFHHLRIKK
jgi:hypothetical protein